jgi:hypothetical protein
LFLNKEHLTIGGRDKLRSLKSGMNNKRIIK